MIYQEIKKYRNGVDIGPRVNIEEYDDRLKSYESLINPSYEQPNRYSNSGQAINLVMQGLNTRQTRH